MVKNVTARRHQDSEINDAHLDGYIGNVKRHPQHVVFDTQSDIEERRGIKEAGNRFNGQHSLKKITIPEIECANKEHNLMGMPRIMEERLGPKLVSGGIDPGLASIDDDIIVKIVPRTSSAEHDFMVEAEAVSLVCCKLLPSEEVHEELNNLILQPVYWREFRLRQQKIGKGISSSPPLGTSKGDIISSNCSIPQAHILSRPVSHPLQSSFYPHMMSITLCFTSQSEGHLYHLPGHLR